MIVLTFFLRHDHVLDDHVAVEFVGVVVLVASAAVLIGPFDRQEGEAIGVWTALEVFLWRERREGGGGGGGGVRIVRYTDIVKICLVLVSLAAQLEQVCMYVPCSRFRPHSGTASGPYSLRRRCTHPCCYSVN